MDALLLYLLILVGIITLLIAALALTNRMIFKMAARNFARRKTQSVIVIAGLMIGTSIISASLVVGDTMGNFSEINVYSSLGEIDEDIWGFSQYGTVVYFNESISDSISANLSTVPEIDAVAPVIIELGSVFDIDTLLGEPRASLLGLDSQIMRDTAFGDLDEQGFYPDSLGEDEVAINSRLADEMDASVGDTIQLSYGAKSLTDPLTPDFRQTNLTIMKIIKERDLHGKANFYQQKTVFLELDVLQQMLNRHNEINHVWISNKGDYIEGEAYTNVVIQTIEDELDRAVGGAGGLGLEVHKVKADNLESARAGSELIGQMFLILGLFSIIAGIVLIINIFVMLGEERKSEMGIARAIGMKTRLLVRMYVLEGSLYAFVAAIVGAFLGLFFGWIMIQAFDRIFGSFEEFGEAAFNIPFHFTWDSVFIAFCAGLLITFVTVFFISTRITKLNIIRAIRRIPEPRTSGTKRRQHYIGAVLVVFGILICFWGFNSKAGAGWTIGLPCIFIGSAMIVCKWISFRAAITAASILIMFFVIPPFEIPVVSEADYSGVETFVLNGVLLVLAGVFIVMFNSDLLLRALQRTIGRGKSTRAVLKTAISYPMYGKFKTGMTLGMFALIIFTVTVIAMFASMQASQSDAMLREQSGGYDIMGNTIPGTPFVNLSVDTLPIELQDIEIEQLEIMTSAYVTVLEYDQTESEAGFYATPGTMEVEQYQLLGVSETFLLNNGFTLMERDDRYGNDRDAWQALNENSSYCIVDGSKLAYGDVTLSSEIVGAYVGGTITITDMGGQNRTRILTVIGIMDQSLFFQGIMLKEDVVKNEYGGADSLVVVELGEGEDAESVAKAFEKTYLGLGLQTSDLVGIINGFLSFIKNFMYLMQGFLGIGLLVGIAGIGIISYRNVIERRQQIGMLRAIGFKRSMITKSFIIETSFITILAIFIGIAVGIGFGWQMNTDLYEEASFVIPWMNLLVISVIAYATTLIFTFYPSLKAAKIPPAEALRYN
jgi:putative ABC transport system permease protein